MLITKNVITPKSNEDARDKTAYFAMYGGGAIFNILHIFRGDLKRAKNHFIIENNIECLYVCAMWWPSMLQEVGVKGRNYRHLAISSVKCENLVVKYVRELSFVCVCIF